MLYKRTKEGDGINTLTVQHGLSLPLLTCPLTFEGIAVFIRSVFIPRAGLFLFVFLFVRVFVNIFVCGFRYKPNSLSML